MNEGEDSGLAYQGVSDDYCWYADEDQALDMVRDALYFNGSQPSKLSVKSPLDNKPLTNNRNLNVRLRLDTPPGFPLHIINNPFPSTTSKDN